MARQTTNVPSARPFLKWAGGKTQLLDEFAKRLPPDMQGGGITTYVEPFIGGGAFFFHLGRQFPFRKCVICDANEELVLTYRVVRRSAPTLIAMLATLESEYRSMNDTERELFFYNVRDAFNRTKRAINFRRYGPAWVERAAQVIFLNRTCYNGLFRMNSRGEFNVPFGRYSNPAILDPENLTAAAAALKTTRILLGDFTACGKHVDERTFVYLDPPYRPLNRTSSFTAYSRDGFSEVDQKRLAALFREFDDRGARIMLSNSDPRNEDPNDSFFDDLYDGYTIERVSAKRMISCNGARRGDVNELIITNY